MTTPSAFETNPLGAQNFTTENHNVMNTALQPSTPEKSNRLDWILYAVPSTAFVMGLYLFTLVLIRHKKREKRIIREMRLSKTNCMHYRLNGFATESATPTENLYKAQPAEAQSYENVEAAVYLNRSGVTYYIRQPEGNDYVTPDSDECESEKGTEQPQEDGHSLHLAQNITDTDDGESYENMESTLYAHPRKQKETDGQDGEYIDPDETLSQREEGEKPSGHLTDTDEESYENMTSPACPEECSQSDPSWPSKATASQDEEEEDSYVKMASIT